MPQQKYLQHPTKSIPITTAECSVTTVPNSINYRQSGDLRVMILDVKYSTCIIGETNELIDRLPEHSRPPAAIKSRLHIEDNANNIDKHQYYDFMNFIAELHLLAPRSGQGIDTSVQLH